MSILKAGAAVVPVEIGADCFPNVEGFDGLSDSHIRALCVDCGEKLLIITVEVTSVMPQAMAELLAVSEQVSGLPAERIWICATHTFGCPHIWNDDAARLKTDGDRRRNAALRHAFTSAVAMAAQEAVKSCRPAKLSYGESRCGVNVSRDVETKDGWWLGHNEDEVSDKTVAVLKFTDTADNPLALLFNYGVQSSVTMRAVGESGMGQITGDLAGEACLYLEREFGVPAVFCVGACGDQSPMFRASSTALTASGELRDTALELRDAFTVMRLLGDRLGESAAKAAAAATPVQAEALRLGSATVVCPGQRIRPIPELHATREYDYGSLGEPELTVVGAALGDVALLGALPEMTSRMAIKLKSESPVKHTLLLNMVSSIKRTEGKYLADDEAYDKYKYEAMNSKYARGSAEIFHKAAVSLLSSLARD